MTVVRIDRVYTKSGDKGTTALIGGQRVEKDSARIDCYGTVDELNAVLGLVTSSLDDSPARDKLRPLIVRIQNELFNLGSQLATPEAERRATQPRVTQAHVSVLEHEMDELNALLPALKSFVLPGGGFVSSHLHLARTICRRAERLVVALARGQDVDPVSISYLNRLSDALFVFSRWAAVKEGTEELLWDSRGA